MGHELKVYESGSRELKWTHNGEQLQQEVIGFNTEMFVEAECSCGKSFTDDELAYKHLKQAQTKGGQ